MDLKHWIIKFKVGGVEREMRVAGDAVQTREQAITHVKSVFAEATDIRPDDGSAPAAKIVEE